MKIAIIKMVEIIGFFVRYCEESGVQNFPKMSTSFSLIYEWAKGICYDYKNAVQSRFQDKISGKIVWLRNYGIVFNKVMRMYSI